MTPLLLVLAIALTAQGVAPADPPPLATISATPGLATFGQVLPPGAARGPLRLGDLETQTDVKATWPDGSIRFAIVTAEVTRAGTYPLRGGEPMPPPPPVDPPVEPPPVDPPPDKPPPIDPPPPPPVDPPPIDPPPIDPPPIDPPPIDPPPPPPPPPIDLPPPPVEPPPDPPPVPPPAARPISLDFNLTWLDGTVISGRLNATVTAPGPAPPAVSASQVKGGSRPRKIAGTMVPSVPRATPQSPPGRSVGPSPRAMAPFLVRFTIAGTSYTASLPADKTPTPDLWLDGPLVVESRRVLAPAAPDGTPHPYLRVIFDVRRYRNGARRVDATIENCLNAAGAGPVDYAIEVLDGDRLLFSRPAVHHPWLARWGELFPLDGLVESTVTPDFEPAIVAGALPRYRDDPTPVAYSTASARFDVLGPGGIFFPMAGPGGRPDIAPYPDWTARFLATGRPDARAYTLSNGDHAGTFWCHIREPEDGPYHGLGPGRLISIQERPLYWAFAGGRPGQVPVGRQDATPDLRPNAAHAPSLAYVPYLVTGDRYYADEMSFWANSHLLNNWGSADLPRGADGLIVGNSTGRAVAWSLRDLADAAAYLPDEDPCKAYFARAVKTNLEHLDRHARANAGPLGMAWVGPMGTSNGRSDPTGKHVWVQPWQQTFLAWAVGHANRQGFPGGGEWRDQAARLQLRLFTTPDEYPREYAGPDSIAIGDWVVGENGVKMPRLYTTLAEVFRATYIYPEGATGPVPPTPFAGFYGLDGWVALDIAAERAMDGAEEAMGWLEPQIEAYRRNRAGWYLERSPAP